MAITLGDVIIWIKPDDSKLDQGLRGAEQKTRGWAGRVGGFLSNAASFAVGGFIQQGVSAITGSIGGLASEMINSNAAFEQYETRFETLLGSTDAAKERMADLAEFGAKTPFELPGVVEADIVLQGFGLHSEEAAKKFGFSGEQIRTIAGDVASGTGSDFKEMALLIGKFSAGATGEAISRMMELGITNRDELAKMGLEFSKSGQLLSPLPESMNVVLQLMQDKYGGLMDAQSSTFEGMMSNLEDWKGNMLRTIGAPIFEVLKDKLGSLLEFLSSPAVMASIDKFAQMLARGIGVAMDFLKNTFFPVLQDLGQYFLAVVEDGDFLNDWLGHLPESIQPIIKVVGQIVAFIVEQAIPTLKQFGTWFFSEGLPAIQAFIAPILAQLIPGLTQLAKWIGDIAAFLLPLLSKWWNFLADHLNIVLPILGAVGVAIAVLSSPITLIIGLIVLLATAWANNWGGIQEKTQAAVAFVQNILNFLAGVVSSVLGYIQSWWQQHGESVKTIINALWSVILTIFKAAAIIIGAIVLGVVTAVKSFWQTWGDEIIKIAQLTWDTIKTIIKSVLDIIGYLIDAFAALIRGDWDALGEALQNIWSTAWGAIKTIFTNEAEALKTLVSGLKEDILGFFSDIGEKFKEIGKSIVTGIKNGINDKWEDFKDWIDGLVGGLVDFIKGGLGIKSPSLVFADIGQNMMAGLAIGIEGARYLPERAMDRTVTNVSNVFNQTIYTSYAGNASGEFQMMRARLST